MDIIGFCYGHDTYICQDCSYEHLMCDKRVLLIDVQKKVVLHGKELKQRVAEVKLDYEGRLKKITALRGQLHDQMNERLTLFNTLVEEIKKAMNEHFAYVEKDLDEAIEKVSRFPALCAENIRILEILEKRNAIYKIDPDTFKRFCMSFDNELNELKVPIDRLEFETSQITKSANNFLSYVSGAGKAVQKIRDHIVFGSRVQNKHYLTAMLDRTFKAPGQRINREECQKIFLLIIDEMNLYFPPTMQKATEAFATYEFNYPDSIIYKVAADAIFWGMQKLNKDLVDKNEFTGTSSLCEIIEPEIFE